ncbi:MAG TPA: thioesterase family protein [Solirubrobacteraceae bacterium]|nr:thioesterase family protein [Solirubrobacteraceae bacterium]
MAAADVEAPVRPLFEPTQAGYAAAPATRGPWDPQMMHGGAPSALLAHAVEQVQPGGELAVARLTIEFFGGVPLGPVAVGTSLAKPGKRFQVVDATLDAGERRACLARAVRLRHRDMPGAAAAPASSKATAPLPPPQSGTPLPQFVGLDDALFYPDATEIRHVGGELGSGHAIAWIRLRGELLPGVTPSPLVRAAAAADFANGLSWILPFDEWLFVNTELTVHVHRRPEGEWIGLDARTVSERSGIGLSSGVLHDRRGPFGLCAQALFVQRR